MRTVKMKHVGITADGGSEICVGGCLPLVFEVGAVDAFQAHRSHPASCDIEARGECHDIDFVHLAVRSLDAGLSELDNLVAALLGDVDNVHVVLVQNFIVVLLEARPLCQKLAIKDTSSVVTGTH